MTAYERIACALQHKETDRIPFDLGGTFVTGMNCNTYKKLRDYLGLPKTEVKILDVTQQLAFIDVDVADRLHADVRPLTPSAPHNKGQSVSVCRKDNYYVMTDEWGVVWNMPIEGGHYFDTVGYPFADAEEIDDLKDYQWPDPCDFGRYETLKTRADNIVTAEKRAFAIGRFCSGTWEMFLRINGFEKGLCDMAMNEQYVHYIMDKITDLKMQYWDKALDMVGNTTLVVTEADDLASQISPLISLEMYKKLISPYHKKLFDFIHRKVPNCSIFYHTCGAAKSFIPSLIEEGVNILNPVQVSAAGMNTKELKKEFGKDITFWGGGIDTQHILPHGTPQQIRDEVRRRVDDLASGGGFVFSTVHNVQSDVSPENYMAMWNALQDYC